jgi:hypothetical protein
LDHGVVEVRALRQGSVDISDAPQRPKNQLFNSLGISNRYCLRPLS